MAAKLLLTSEFEMGAFWLAAWLERIILKVSAWNSFCPAYVKRKAAADVCILPPGCNAVKVVMYA